MTLIPDITPDSRRVPPHPLTPALPPGPCADCAPAFWSGVFLAAVVAFVIAALVSVAI